MVIYRKEGAAAPSLCVEPQRLILSPPRGDIDVYGVFPHDEPQPLCWRKWNKVVFELVVKVVLLFVLVRRGLGQHVLCPVTAVPGLQRLSHVPVEGHLLGLGLGQPAGVVLPLQVDLQLGGVGVDRGGEAVVQLGDVRAAFLLVVVFAELDADLAGRGRVDRRGGQAGRSDGVAGLAAAAVPPPAERQFGDARVVLQDQLSVVPRDAALLLAPVLRAAAALGFVPAQRLAAVGQPVVLPVPVCKIHQHAAAVGEAGGVARRHRHKRLPVGVLVFDAPLGPEPRQPLAPGARAPLGVAALQQRRLKPHGLVEVLLHVRWLRFDDNPSWDWAQAVQSAGFQRHSSGGFLGFDMGPGGPTSSVSRALAAVAASHVRQAAVLLGGVAGEAALLAQRLLRQLLCALLLLEGHTFTPEAQLAAVCLGQRLALGPRPATPQLDFTE